MQGETLRNLWAREASAIGQAALYLVQVRIELMTHRFYLGQPWNEGGGGTYKVSGSGRG